MPNISLVKFSKKNEYSRPWRELYDEVEESRVESLLADGVELSVQGPDQSTPLPLKDHQDLLEFQAFENGATSAQMEHPALATELIKLKNKGAGFFATVKDKKEEVGAYGAYNFITQGVGIEALQVVFTQAKIQGSESPLGLFEAAINNPQIKDPQQLSKLADSFATQAPNAKLQEAKLYKAAVKKIATDSPRASFSYSAASATHPDGSFKYQHPESRIALYETGLNPELSKGEFIRIARKSVHPEDRAQVCADLVEEFYPETNSRLKKWFGHSPKDVENFQQAFLSYTSIYDPEFKRPVALMNFSDSDSSDHWEMLLRTALENPGLQNLSGLVKVTANRFDDSEEQQQNAQFLYRGVLNKVSKNYPHTEVALGLAQRALDNGDIESAGSVNSLYQAALNPDLSMADFMVESVGQAHEADQFFMTHALGKTLFSDPEIDVPQEIWDDIDAGRYTAPELREVYETLRFTQVPSNEVSIGVEDDQIIVGDEFLEVDL